MTPKCKRQHNAMRKKKRGEWPKSWQAEKRKALAWAKYVSRQLLLFDEG